MKPIAILCSDLHLSLQKPACRADKDWLSVQAHYLKQICDQSFKLAGGEEGDESIPVICAGDIFDKWNTPPELINFALRCLPDGMICIPGQHDLPNHSMAEIERSGYQVLVRAGKIIDATEMAIDKFPISVYGYGFGHQISPLTRMQKKDLLGVAVIHQYIWLDENTKYPDADDQDHLSKFKPIFKTFDAVVIGDNHKGWSHTWPGTSVINCGAFIRRKSDEISYRPGYGLLYSDRRIVRKFFDTSIDRFHENPKKREEEAFNMQEFINSLEGLGEHGLNFREAVENHLRKEDLDDETKKIILECLESKEA